MVLLPYCPEGIQNREEIHPLGSGVALAGMELGVFSFCQRLRKISFLRHFEICARTSL